MTEAMTTTSGTEEERPRCTMGSKTDHPCWREATERAFRDDPGPTLCAEHYRYIQLGREEDELLCHLDTVGTWIATWDDPNVGETRLQYHAFTMRQRLVEELWRASVKAEAAEYIARQGPDEEPLTFEQAEHRAALTLQSRAVSVTHQRFQDLQAVPEEAFGSGSRWLLAAALHAVGDGVNAEYDRYRREIGRR